MSLKIIRNIVFDFIHTHTPMKIFLNIIPLLKVDCFEGFSNWNKTDGMVTIRVHNS